MNAPRTNISGIARAGRSASSTYGNIADTARKYGPRYDEMAVADVKARSQEKQAAIIAERNVRAAEAKAENLLERTEIDIDTYNAKRSAAKTSRKAGMIAVAGQLAGIALEKKEEPIRPLTLNYDERFNLVNEQLQETRNEITAGANEYTGTDPDSIKPDYSGIPTAKTENNSPSNKPVELASKSGGQPAGKVSSDAKSGGQSSGKVSGLRLMNTLIGKGYSPVSAAAIAGNAAHESGNFIHHEELKKNNYGTKGVGYLQWTNAGGGMRRTEFENWSKSQGLDPRSFEASAGYIDAEMKGGRHWTGGMNTESFKRITNLNEATRAFQDNYLRPNKQYANTDARLNYANQFYNQYLNQNK